jgi:hypothetical protein
MSTKQKDAVFNAITMASEQGLEGDSAHAFAVEQVKTGLMSGEIQHSAGAITDPKKAESYAKALIANWRKKDDRLTGGVKYVPATKRGPIVKDDMLKKLNESLKSLKVNQPGNAELIARVEAAITARKAELAAAKAQSKVQSLDETLSTLADLGIEVA